MRKHWKTALIAVGCVAVVALWVGAFRLSAIRQNPLRAFDANEMRASADHTEWPIDTMTPTHASALPSLRILSDINATATPSPSASPSATPNPTQTAKASPTPRPTPIEQPVEAAFEKTKQDNVIGLLLLGIDTSEEREEKQMGWRSDVMIACAIDLVQNKTTALTIPRDTRAKVDKLDKSGNPKNSVTDKINAAFAYGGGAEKQGHENALRAVNRLLETDITYYASIDMDAIGPLADAVGGVEITLDVTIPDVGKKGETVLLKGDKASAFVRKRHGVTGGSDLNRTERQKQFLLAFAQKVKSSDAIKTVPKLYQKMRKRVHTNLNVEQILALSMVLARMDDTDLTFETIPGRTKSMNGRSYYLCDEAKTRSRAKDVFGS